MKKMKRIPAKVLIFLLVTMLASTSVLATGVTEPTENEQVSAEAEEVDINNLERITWQVTRRVTPIDQLLTSQPITVQILEDGVVIHTLTSTWENNNIVTLDTSILGLPSGNLSYNILPDEGAVGWSPAPVMVEGSLQGEIILQGNQTDLHFDVLITSVFLRVGINVFDREKDVNLTPYVTIRLLSDGVPFSTVTGTEMHYFTNLHFFSWEREHFGEITWEIVDVPEGYRQALGKTGVVGMLDENGIDELFFIYLEEDNGKGSGTGDGPDDGNGNGNGDSDNGNDSHNGLMLQDATTGITLEAGHGVLPAGTRLVVNHIDSADAFYATIENALGVNYRRNTSHRITLLDANGNRIQPTGYVTVSVPIPDDYNRNLLSKYYVSATGELAGFNHTISADGSMLRFNTNHFSVYTLAERVATSATGIGAGVVTAPQTGDIFNLGWMYALLSASLFTLSGILTYKGTRTKRIKYDK